MVFGLFSKEKALQRTIEKATNKLAQQPDRWGAMEQLRDNGSEAALYGLCKRWAIVSMKGSEDEQEKNWVVDVMVGKGEGALAPVRRYMKNHAQLSYALKVLGQIVDRDGVLEVIDELLDDEAPGYTRDPERRLDIIKWLGEWSGGAEDDMIPRLAPYLKDHSEDVRYFAADALARIGIDKVSAHLIEALTNPEEEAGRFKRHLADLLAQGGVGLGDAAEKVKAALTGPALQAFVVKDGKIVKK
jgi:HEAT repeat protein